MFEKVDKETILDKKWLRSLAKRSKDRIHSWYTGSKNFEYQKNDSGALVAVVMTRVGLIALKQIVSGHISHSLGQGANIAEHDLGDVGDR